MSLAKKAKVEIKEEEAKVEIKEEEVKVEIKEEDNDGPIWNLPIEDGPKIQEPIVKERYVLVEKKKHVKDEVAFPDSQPCSDDENGMQALAYWGGGFMYAAPLIGPQPIGRRPQVAGLKWLLSEGFMSDEEYQKSLNRLNERKRVRKSGEPSPGPGADAAAATPAAPKRKLDTTELKWIKRNALPPVERCTIHHLKREKAWTVYYPGCRSLCRTYGAHTGVAKDRTCLTALNCVLNWAWERHRIATGVENHRWDFEPRCD